MHYYTRKSERDGSGRNRVRGRKKKKPQIISKTISDLRSESKILVALFPNSQTDFHYTTICRRKTSVIDVTTDGVLVYFIKIYSNRNLTRTIDRMYTRTIVSFLVLLSRKIRAEFDVKSKKNK